MSWWNRDDPLDIDEFPTTMKVRSTEFHQNKREVYAHLREDGRNTVLVTKWDRPLVVVMTARAYIDLISE